MACCSKIRRAIGSPAAPKPRTSLAALASGSTAASSCSGNWVSQYGSRFFSIPVSEATLSASPYRPQLQDGTGCPSASSPSSGICTWPSSPAMPAAPLTTWPASTRPPPSPVPTMAATEECSAAAAAPNRAWCA